ncbi:MAG: D-alanine--D-alanine ligase family protein [Eubacteriales bacterium]
MDKKLAVAFIFGGASSEYEVSCVSAASVLDNTDTTKYDIYKIGINKSGAWFLYEGENRNISDGSWALEKGKLTPLSLCLDGQGGFAAADGRKISPDCAFPVMHGRIGEDGRIQGLLDITGIPCCGSGVLSSACAMDKAVTKIICGAAGIPQGNYRVVMRGTPLPKAQELAAQIGYPLFIKPANAGSSVGISKVKTPAELSGAMDKAFEHDSKLLLEEFISGGEVEVSVLGNGELFVSTPGEIDPGSDFYDYDTKYVSDTAKYFIPARIPAAVADKVRSYAAGVFRALGCSGFSRVDFFVDGENIIFNEINTIPGFTSISMYAKLMANDGVGFGELIDRIITLAMEHK